MNHLILVGIVEGSYKVVLDNSSRANKLLEFIISVDSPYKNKDGSENKNMFKIKAWSNIIGDPDAHLADQELVCVKGHVKSFTYTDKKGHLGYFPEIMAEKLTNLSFYA